jgi:hypothetical protein
VGIFHGVAGGAYSPEVSSQSAELSSQQFHLTNFEEVCSQQRKETTKPIEFAAFSTYMLPRMRPALP